VPKRKKKANCFSEYVVSQNGRWTAVKKSVPQANHYRCYPQRFQSLNHYPFSNGYEGRVQHLPILISLFRFLLLSDHQRAVHRLIGSYVNLIESPTDVAILCFYLCGPAACVDPHSYLHVVDNMSVLDAGT